ncbi:M4 family metallopeptidase [Nocardia sp. CDC159]|uniref:Neutral metalloproteinase n=1 Tax=Nocardia pulmonis TaxID=2951408 RepID=A0A9X2IWH6_9NOCA|nr:MULTISPECIES: M4 family metallopeptidase [Nocardia]MCM6771896.1 M4 family metallopeptidase [Nocardia pulmonis]MCM6785446.1 M4 family metallopeptidase [Nocardia sp. CDC159]
MDPRKRAARYTALSVIMLATTIFVSTSAYGEPPTPPPHSSDLIAVPKAVLQDPEGTTQQVVPQQPLPVPSGTPREAPAAARAHAPGVAKMFTGRQIGTLVVDQVLPVGAGATVRLRQEIDSVPVFGASVAQLLAEDGSLVSAAGSLTQRSQGRFATTEPSRAVAETAVRAIAERAKTSPGKLTPGAIEPYWYDAKLAAAPDGTGVAVPAFKVEVEGDKVGRFVVFVDATDTGRVLDSWDTTMHLTRVVCDAENKPPDPNGPKDPVCGGPNGVTPARVEGQSPTGIKDVDEVYDYLGNTDGFYRKHTQLKDLTALLGTDAGDEHGKALRATVRVNAMWRGGTMAFAEGMATEDIVGHELTHGVTQHTSGLVYRNEPGAINESMSDIFGELVFLTDTANKCNTPANRWKLGACSAAGVVRDMKNPKAHRQPDTYRGAYWYTGTADSGGVHTNSGVGNKAAQLMVDGGKHNGVTVSGIGIEKAAALYWTTQTMLTANATYRTLGSTLTSACRANVTNRVAGTTEADCTEVANAVKAVKMPTLNTAG